MVCRAQFHQRHRPVAAAFHHLNPARRSGDLAILNENVHSGIDLMGRIDNPTSDDEPRIHRARSKHSAKLTTQPRPLGRMATRV